MKIQEAIHAHCQANGIPVVATRALVAGHLISFDAPTDGDTLWMSMRENNIKICAATFYATLKWLSQNGFIQGMVTKNRKNN